MGHVRDLSIRTKLFGGFGAVLLVSVALGVFLIVQLGNVNAGGVYIARNSLPSVQLISQIQGDEAAYRADQLGNITNTNLALSRAPIAAAAAVQAQIQADFRRYEAMVSNATDARLLSSTKSQWAAYVASTPKLVLAASNTTQPPIVALANSSAVAFQALAPPVRAWLALNHQLASSRTAANSSTYSIAVTLGIALLAIAIMIGLAIAVLITRPIKRATDQMLRAAEAIAEGDVDQRVDAASSDELGRTTAAFARMIEYLKAIATTLGRLAERDLTVAVEPKSDRDLVGNALRKLVQDMRSIIGNVSTAAIDVSAASQEMSATSDESGRATGEIARALGDIAAGAERQVQMVEHARESAGQVSRAVAETAESAKRTAEVATRAREAAQQGVTAAEQASDAMRAVRDSSGEVSSTISELAEKSSQIGAIVRTITGIAEQTNLLALNAAIEAARAGEQGRGFAVVADEVRKLAEEARSAAREIAGLIAAIQTQTERAVEVVSDGARRTDEGAGVVEQTRAAFVEIDASVQDMADRIEEIAAASQQVSASALGMQESINEVAAVAEQSSASTQEVSASTEETSASAQEIAASAAELSTNAEKLSRLVAGFKLG